MCTYVMKIFGHTREGSPESVGYGQRVWTVDERDVHYPQETSGNFTLLVSRSPSDGDPISPWKCFSYPVLQTDLFFLRRVTAAADNNAGVTTVREKRREWYTEREKESKGIRTGRRRSYRTRFVFGQSSRIIKTVCACMCSCPRGLVSNGNSRPLHPFARRVLYTRTTPFWPWRTRLKRKSLFFFF